MKTTLFDWVATLTLATLLLGILGGTQTGSAFSLAPIAALLNAQVNPHDVSDEPLEDVARRAGANVQDAAKDAIATAAQDQTDPRLAACREGSQESGEAIAIKKAMTVQQMELGSLIEVQLHLGEPHCNERTVWRYLIEGGGILIATESRGGVNVTLHR